MRIAELFAAPAAVADHPAVRAAARMAAEELAPRAARADDPAVGVQAAQLRALAGAGLLSVGEPVELGGFAADLRTQLEVVELLSGACGATWFVTTQHESVTAFSRRPPVLLREGGAEQGPAAELHRDAVGSATELSGVAVAHLRRPGPPAITAEPRGSGYRFTGRADWVTGWGLVDVLQVAGVTADDGFVFALLPATERPGLRAGGPLPLSVMGGTRTVALELTGVEVAADEVLLTVDGAVWREHDRCASANAKPGALGLLRRVLTELQALARERGDEAALETARRLAGPAARMRERAYELAGTVPPRELVEERAALRGALAELTVRAAHALVAVRAGRAMLGSSPEQRWAREAAFHLIQAQTPAVRAAQLAAFGR